MGIIYVIRNLVNCKTYVGQAIDFTRRKKKHLRNASTGRTLSDETRQKMSEAAKRRGERGR